MKRIRILYIVFAVLTFASVFGFWTVNQVFANYLVTTSDIITRANEIIQEGQVLHFSKTLYVRRDPHYSDPLDPYHMPLLPLLTESPVVEIWHSPHVMNAITWSDNSKQLALGEFIEKPNSRLIYDAIEGHAAEYPIDKSIASAATESVQTINDVSWISSVRESEWGSTAWVIQFDSKPAQTEQFSSSMPALPIRLIPYAADLAFDRTQWTWEVDQASGLVVSRKWLALTQPEPTILYAETYLQPEIMAASTLTRELGSFITADAAQLQSDIETITNLDATAAEKLMIGVATPITDIASNLSFPVYSFASAGIEQMSANNHNRRIYFSQQHKCHRERPLAFDFDLCAGLGETVRQEYTFWDSEDYDDLKAINVLQGEAKEVVPVLQQTPPQWNTSEPLTLTVQNQLVEAWGVPALHGDQNTKALMFELDGTFIQLSGFGTSIDQLTMVAENLYRVNSASSSRETQIHRLFIPHVGR